MSPGRQVCSGLAACGRLLAVSSLLWSPGSRAFDWDLSESQLEALRSGEILVDADVDRDRNRGDVRAAVAIEAVRDVVYGAMTSCPTALTFVPHLRRCVVLETAPDRSWQVIEHVVDLGWYLPGTRYVIRAEYDPGRSVRFQHLRGDLSDNSGLWELRPAPGWDATIVTYRVRVVPRFYVPQWLIRRSLKQELPALLEALRRHSEAAHGSLEMELTRPAAPA